MRLVFDQDKAQYFDKNCTLMAECSMSKLAQASRSIITSQTSGPPSIGILPPRVVWISPTHDAIIFERPPTTMPISFHSGTALHPVPGANYDLPLPWTVYAVKFTAPVVAEMRIFSRNQPIRDVTDKLGIMPIPNMMANSLCCLGEAYQERISKHITNNKNAGKEITLSELTGWAVNEFWSNVFNMDIGNWHDVYRLPQTWPVNLKNEDGVPSDIRALNIIKWLNEQDKYEAMKWKFVGSNFVNPKGDTVADVIQHLTIPKTAITDEKLVNAFMVKFIKLMSRLD